MQITYTTRAAPGRPHNEDYVIAGPTWVAVLDGATAPAGVHSGCVHDVPWLVAQLGAALARQLESWSEEVLPDLVAAAIRAAMTAHEDTCDLRNPDSPSATLSVLRQRDRAVDYLVLCDSPIALQHTDGTLTVIHDDRTDHLPGGRPYSLDLVRSLRNQPGGFWVASTEPEAAYQALTGSAPLEALHGALMLTDGVTRLVDWYGHTWDDLVKVASEHGPHQLITRVRDAEEAHPPLPPAKAYDDATAAWVSWPGRGDHQTVT